MSLWAFLFVLLTPSFLFDDVKGGEEVVTIGYICYACFPFQCVFVSECCIACRNECIGSSSDFGCPCPCNLLKIYMTIHFVWWNLLQILIWCMRFIAILLSYLIDWMLLWLDVVIIKKGEIVVPMSVIYLLMITTMCLRHMNFLMGVTRISGCQRT